jgi:hypothetical protein
MSLKLSFPKNYQNISLNLLFKVQYVIFQILFDYDINHFVIFINSK